MLHHSPLLLKASETKVFLLDRTAARTLLLDEELGTWITWNCGPLEAEGCLKQQQRWIARQNKYFISILPEKKKKLELTFSPW